MPIEWGLVELGIEVATRGWDAIKNREALYNTERFVKAHQENLEKSIDNLQDISNHSPEVLRDGARETLKMIAAVVKANIRDENVEVNANYMIPRAPSDDVMNRALFCNGKRRSDSYACFLELQMWAHRKPDLPKDVVLPVDTSAEAMLFGAPRAYATAKTDIVRNTRVVHKGIDRKVHREVRQKVENYFHENHAHIRSFASIPMRVPPFGNRDPQWMCTSNDVIAVVNIDSSKTSVLGVFKGNQRKLGLTLAPFVHILAHHVLRLHYVKPSDT